MKEWMKRVGMALGLATQQIQKEKDGDTKDEARDERRGVER